MRTAVGVIESSHVRVMRVADNMRNVAVTEGDKVEAQIKFGWEVDAYPVNEIAESVDAVSAADVNTLVEEYYDKYEILLEGRDPEEFRKHVAVQAQIELGFERFLEEKNYQAIVTHFGDLGALKQLPGLAIQRLMEKGYGFGAEGDWKTAAMVRLMKIMTAGMKDAKGTSMLEDYTYNLVKGKEGILEAHMLEICPSIADGPISIKCQPLSMGDREDPARLVFTSKEGHGIATSLIDLGNRFRLIINDVECKKTEKPMPKLPTATNFCCGGSATDLPKQTPVYAKMFNVVDSFDTHARIPEHFANVDAAAKEGGHVGIISVGWDPGMFSLNRLYANAILPDGNDYTFWGKGVSQGHSDAIRRIKGVKMQSSTQFR